MPLTADIVGSTGGPELEYRPNPFHEVTWIRNTVHILAIWFLQSIQTTTYTLYSNFTLAIAIGLFGSLFFLLFGAEVVLAEPRSAVGAVQARARHSAAPPILGLRGRTWPRDLNFLFQFFGLASHHLCWDGDTAFNRLHSLTHSTCPLDQTHPYLACFPGFSFCWAAPVSEPSYWLTWSRLRVGTDGVLSARHVSVSSWCAPVSRTEAPACIALPWGPPCRI